MKLFSGGSFLLRLFCFFILVVLASLQFGLALGKQIKFSKRIDFASFTYQLDPHVLSRAAKEKHLFAGDLVLADSLYRRALFLSSTYIPAWLGLAELRIDQKKKEQANKILDYASELSTGTKLWRWDKALLAYQLGRRDVLSSDLAFIIREIRGKQRSDALRLAFATWSDPVELCKVMGHDNLVHLLRYATKRKKVEEALVFWETIKNEGVEIKEWDVLLLVNMLLFNKLPAGVLIWKEYFNPDKLLFNGDFSNQPLQRGFGWRIGKREGVSWKIEKSMGVDRYNSLHLHFKGTNNVRLTVPYQIVPLDGGKSYLFRGELKTKGIATDQRPYLLVHGYKCRSFSVVKGDMVEPEQSWVPFSLVFDVPDECQAVVVQLRRNESRLIDNKLSGDIWLANFELLEVGAEAGLSKEE